MQGGMGMPMNMSSGMGNMLMNNGMNMGGMSMNQSMGIQGGMGMGMP